jgi:hydroxymethylpyrimidine pyrophosphatase-like HAD family hydrolase
LKGKDKSMGKKVSYQTRSMDEDARQKMRMIAVKTGRNLEEVVNRVIEIGLPQLEAIVAQGGW